MVAFCSVDSLRRYLHAVDLGQLLVELTDEMEATFRRWNEFQLIPRVASHSTYGVIELMPTQDYERYAFKYVNGHPINTKVGRQTVVAFGMVADVETGYPIFMSEMTVLTALRTAATAGLATRLLASPEQLQRPNALIGAGAQAEFQAIAQHALFGATKFNVHDTDPDAVKKLQRNLTGMGLEVEAFESSSAAVAGSGVITTCTADKRNAIVLHDDDVATTHHINALGGDCPGKTELDPVLVNRSDIYVELEPQTRIEGEIQQLPDANVTELWTLIGGDAAPNKGDVTLFDSVGFAIEDFVVLNFMFERLAQTSFLSEIDLLAEPADPKDLYGFMFGGANA